MPRGLTLSLLLSGRIPVLGKDGHKASWGSQFSLITDWHLNCTTSLQMFLSHTTLILNRTVTHVHHVGPWVYISLLVFEVPQATWANMLKDAVVKTLIPHLQCWTQTKRTAGFKRYYPFSWSRVSQLVQWAIENYIILCKETIGIRAPFPFGL